MASVRLPHGVSFLLDTGSPGNLCGSEWSKEMAREASKYGLKPEYERRERPMTCRGIGTGSQTAEWDVKHPIMLGNGRVDSFGASELPNSRTPALLGRNSLRNYRSLQHQTER